MRPLDQHRSWRAVIGMALLAGVLVLSGCSTRFFYNRLDTFATWYFESLVSLNDVQRTELRAWLQRTLAWHRESELVRYAEFVNDISTQVAQPGSAAVFESMRLRLQGLMGNLVERTAPEAAHLLLQLSPAQVDELLDNLAQRARKSSEEGAAAVAKGEWRPKQTKSIVRQLKRWTGEATPQQRELIAASIAQLEPTYAEWAQSQQAWREALRAALLEERAIQGEGQGPPDRLLELLVDPGSQWTDAYSQKVSRNGERYQRLLLDLDASLSPRQRDHLRRELSEVAELLTRLAGG